MTDGLWYAIVSFAGRYPAAGSDDETELEILQEIYASDDGFQDSDGNDIAVTVVNHIDGITDVADLEPNGYWNPFIAGSWERHRSGLRESQGVMLKHAAVTEDATSGRRDLALTGGVMPAKAAPPSGDLAQSVEDWFANRSGSNARLGINALEGSTYDIGSPGVDGTEVSGDPRVRAIIVWLEGLRTAGDALYTDLDDIETWSASIFSGRTFTLDQDTGSGTDNLVFTVSATTSGTARLTFNISKSSGTVDIDAINEILNGTVVDFPTAEEEDKPPFGSTEIPVLAERVVMEGGSLVLDRGLLALWTPTRRKPVGARDILTWETLKTVSGQTYRTLPFGYVNFAVHVESTVNRVIRIPDPKDIVPYIGGAIEFEIHNGNDYTDGKTVEIQTAAGVNIITLLGKEVVPLELEWFQDGSGELRAPGRIPRTFEVAGDDLGDFADVGHWERNASGWARPVLFPSPTERTQELRYNAEAFEIGTASITNGESFTNTGFTMHVPEAIKLLKVGRFKYDLHVVVIVDDDATGTMPWHNASLYLQEGAFETRVAHIPFPSLNPGDSYYWRFYYEDEGGHIGVGDVFCPTFVYPKSTTMGPSSLDVEFYKLNVTLWQDILVEYSS